MEMLVVGFFDRFGLVIQGYPCEEELETSIVAYVHQHLKEDQCGKLLIDVA